MNNCRYKSPEKYLKGLHYYRKREMGLSCRKKQVQEIFYS
jgi:hypothetical protein